jgi:hypothetical protein
MLGGCPGPGAGVGRSGPGSGGVGSGLGAGGCGIGSGGCGVPGIGASGPVSGGPGSGAGVGGTGAGCGSGTAPRGVVAGCAVQAGGGVRVAVGMSDDYPECDVSKRPCAGSAGHGRQQREIDWSGAQVSDGSVTLPLSGDAPKPWSERFAAVVALLAQRASVRWGEVKVTKKAVKVAELQPGAEDDLRHFLQSVVAQVNSELSDETDARAAQPTQGERDPQAGRDAASAERLRSFAGEQQEQHE